MAEDEAPSTKGAEVYYDGSKRYEGDWGMMVRQGTGSYRFIDGNGCVEYDGNWVHGVIESRPAKLGKCVFGNGSVYEGECQGGKFHGTGEYRYFNGDSYRGQWKDNQRWGQGTYTQANGWAFEGTWYKNNKHGEGFFVSAAKGGGGFLEEWKVGYRVAREAITAEDVAQRKEEAIRAKASRLAAALKKQKDAIQTELESLRAALEELDEKKQPEEWADITAKIAALEEKLESIIASMGPADEPAAEEAAEEAADE